MRNLVRGRIVPVWLAVCLLVQAAAWAATPAVVDIATGPLYSGRGNVHPNMVLDLSVEFPTVGAAYRAAYSKTTEYTGYFNPGKCYTYPSSNSVYTATGVLSNGTKYYSKGTTEVYKLTNLNPQTGDKGSIAGYLTKPSSGTYSTYTAGTNTHFTGTTQSTVSFSVPDLTDDNGYFRISGDADSNHECSGAFSGNFMNWAASSSIDMLRYALTGGDRVIDQTDKTVLQRAFLPDGSYNSNSSFYADSSYFPRRTVTTSSTVSAPSKVTPFTATTLYVVSCRNRILFSNTNGGGTCDTQRVVASGSTAVLSTSDKYYGEYLARVQVCDSSEGSTRTSLCSKYGSNYKPEGDLQRYSDKLRAGTFGYLTEHDTGNNNLYGGVLRAPVKYVGAKKFEAPAFEEKTNDKPEWDSTTGIFSVNPESDSSGSSGVINYLNKFGRTNTSRLGAYKSWDPVSELYYESLRYLQGRQPTGGGATTTSSSTTNPFSKMGSDTTDDAFPVLKTWIDPVTSSCQSNYVVVIGDVNTHRDGYIPGSQALGSDSSRAADSANSTWPALNVATWSQTISSMETSSAYGNSSPRTDLTNLATRTDAGSTYGTFNMAGLAYWANTNNIRFDKPTKVKTFAIDVDEGGNGSIDDDNTRSRKPRSSAFYLAAKYGGFLDKNSDSNPFKTYDTDGKTVVANNAEWTGTATGTDPSNYFLASQPGKMISAIHNIFEVVSTNSGTISGVTLTSTKISTDSAYVYQPGFDPSKWSGTLLKLKMSYDSTTNKVTIQDSAYPTWDAGLVLTGKTTAAGTTVAPRPLPDERKIYTAKVNADGSLNTVEFLWDNLTSDQQTYLKTSPVSPYAVESDDMGKKRLNFLRGVRSDEIGYTDGIFRSRDRVLGDIVNSNPTWYGAPANYLRGDDYSTFYNNYKNRTKAVYVGANDGMLHAFDADDGKELFAYVPNALIPYLNQLTDSAYVHRPYVDGQMNIVEAKVNGSWKTILVSGFGGGTQGLFVLDVTDPAGFSSGSKAIWEFTDKDDVDMGNLMSAPVVQKFRIAKNADGTGVYRNFVVIASGYNNYKDDGFSNASSTTDAGKGVLFLLSLDKPTGEAWQAGTNYYKFKTPVSDTSLPNGLSSPAVVAGNDGAVRFIYAGDLQGNLWRFDFTGTALSWTSPGSTPLFVAKDASANRQPITQQPKVILAPGGGYVVLFGTGKFVENADLVATKFKTQSFYAIYDTTYDNVSGRSKLAQRTLTKVTGSDDAFTFSGDTFAYGTSSTSKMGWYFDFYNSGTSSVTACTTSLSSCGTGERSVTDALVAYGNLFVNSLVTGSNPCEKGGGRTYGLCALSGFPFDSNGNCITDGSGISGYISDVGMLSSPVMFDIGTTISDRDSVGQSEVTKKYAIFNFGTGGSAGTAATAKSSGGSDFTGSFKKVAKRLSWREVLNYDELRKTAND
ncbi:MAG: PilC/PilY family type IV pilus protein [Burkholderiaceae bacterium]|nr:PilC/PilY family type IV pilus protein [Burkholderiaceae bacterium]